MEPWAAVVAGAVGGVLYFLFSVFMVGCRVDDPLQASAVHGMCGIWGCFFVGLFATAENIATAYGKVRALVRVVEAGGGGCVPHEHVPPKRGVRGRRMWAPGHDYFHCRDGDGDSNRSSRWAFNRSGTGAYALQPHVSQSAGAFEKHPQLKIHEGDLWPCDKRGYPPASPFRVVLPVQGRSGFNKGIERPKTGGFRERTQLTGP